MFFKNKKTETNETENIQEVNTPAEETKPVEEWVWVDGYKGTDKDMRCNDYQYILGETHNMPEDAEITMCSSGFHLCNDLKDVFRYYGVENNNRFFKVKALVRQKDVDDYYHTIIDNYGLAYRYARSIDGNHKLVAKSIIFEEELSPDEIIKQFTDPSDWTEGQKLRALEIGIAEGIKLTHLEELVGLGYSMPFAQYLVDNKKYSVAKSVGSQTDLSMDMKCYVIFK